MRERINPSRTLLRLAEMQHGVLSNDQATRSGILLGGPASRIAGSAAGYLHQLLPDPPQEISVLVPQDLLVEVVEGVESVLELSYARRVERPHGLPRATRQQTNAAGYRRDVRYDPFATVVELDGQVGHEGMGRFRDMRRDNYATVTGEATLRYGHWDINEKPCLVAREVGYVLSVRGWSGDLHTCVNCRQVPLTEVFQP